MYKKSTIITTVKPFDLSEKNLMATKWQALEKKANCSVFLSWLWIGNWLDLITDKVFLVEAKENDQVVGMGLFVQRTRKVLGLFPIKQWLLHRTGNPNQDQIWIEHNDFLLDERIAEKVRADMLNAVIAYDKSIKEFIFGLSTNETLSFIANNFNKHFSKRTLVETIGYSLNLAKISNDFLNEVLSKNTRSQIKRSKSLLEEKGVLTFNVINNSVEISLLFDQISAIHIDLWEGSADGSGFSNPLFIKFYQQLVASNRCDNSTVEISVLSLDNIGIGYLINYVYNNHVYFYLSALTKNEDNRIKTGLVLHSEAIQYYQRMGLKSYDFLGGEARYKQSLSDSIYGLALTCFSKKSALLNFENMLRLNNPF